MNQWWNRFLIVFIVGVVGSGLLIFGWNKLNGKNLLEPRKFDLSLYDDPSWFIDQMQQSYNQVTELTEIAEDDNKEESEDVKNEQEKLQTGYIYFKNSFKLNNREQTIQMLENFLQDFDVLKKQKIEFLTDKKELEIELPVLNREQILVNLKANSLVEKVNPLAPPSFVITFKSPISSGGANKFIAEISSNIQVKTKFETEADYLARVSYSELNDIQPTLDKLKKQYSDVVFVN